MAGLNPQRIGILGGTFDPPHIGHLILAQEAVHQLSLERLLWVLTPNPPHKRDHTITPVLHRLEMLLAMVAGNSAFEVSRVDIDRPPPHYALDTVRLLRNDFPTSSLIYIMGSDSLRDLPDWHQPQDLISEIDVFGVARREGVETGLPELEGRFPGLRKKIAWIDAPIIEISSTMIRQRAASGQPFRYFVPDEVYEFIRELRLYQSR